MLRASYRLAPLLVLALGVSASAQTPAPFGLDERPSNTTCLPWDRPTPGATVSFQRVFDQVFTNESVSNLTVLIQAPGDPSEWWFATRDGLIGRFDNTPDVDTWIEVLHFTAVVTVPADGGLVGFAFHPEFPSDPRAFLNSSVAPTGGENADIIIASMETTDGGATLDPSTVVELIRQSRRCEPCLSPMRNLSADVTQVGEEVRAGWRRWPAQPQPSASKFAGYEARPGDRSAHPPPPP